MSQCKQSSRSGASLKKFKKNVDSLFVPLEEVRIRRIRDVLFRVLHHQILDVFQPLQRLRLIRLWAGAPLALPVRTSSASSRLFPIGFEKVAAFAFLTTFTKSIHLMNVLLRINFKITVANFFYYWLKKIIYKLRNAKRWRLWIVILSFEGKSKIGQK